METCENIIRNLNEVLEADNINMQQFDDLLKTLKELYNPRIKLIDFEFNNEESIERYRREKIICVKLHNFEKAAYYRSLELECLKYIDLKTEFDIKKSTFHYEQNYLLYFYLGTAKNDKSIRSFLKVFLG